VLRGAGRVVEVGSALLVSLAVLGAIMTAGASGAARRANALPNAIIAGPDGAVWFTELFGKRVGRISTSGRVEEFPLSPPKRVPFSIGPHGIAAGPDGALWFTDGGEVARMTRQGVVTHYPVPGGDTPANAAMAGGLQGIVAGPDRALWFTYGYPSAVGRITTAGAATEFPVSPFAGPLGDIAVGPDGALWVGEDAVNRIARVTTAGTVSELALPPGAGGGEFGLAAGPDGALWYTRGFLTTGAIRRVTTGGALTTFPLADRQAEPGGITAGPDGAMWFTERRGNRIGRITTDGAVSEYPLPTQKSGPGAIAHGRDGALWFTEGDADKIGRITAGGAVQEFSLPPLVFVSAERSTRCKSPVLRALVKTKLLRNGDRLARVAVLLDGRPLTTTTRLKLHLRIPVNVGTHTLEARAIDTEGRHASFSRTFRRCRARG
jgi:virginiamycin B lyase